MLHCERVCVAGRSGWLVGNGAVARQLGRLIGSFLWQMARCSELGMHLLSRLWGIGRAVAAGHRGIGGLEVEAGCKKARLGAERSLTIVAPALSQREVSAERKMRCSSESAVVAAVACGNL